MAYSVNIMKKYQHVRVYSIKKSVKGNQNEISRIIESLINRYLQKRAEKQEA
jgi:hypothetical protein